MSDLSEFRDHCRAMAKAAEERQAAIEPSTDLAHLVAVVEADDEIRLWTNLADEADAWLNRDLGPGHHDEPIEGLSL